MLQLYVLYRKIDKCETVHCDISKRRFRSKYWRDLLVERIMFFHQISSFDITNMIDYRFPEKHGRINEKKSHRNSLSNISDIDKTLFLCILNIRLMRGDKYISIEQDDNDMQL